MFLIGRAALGPARWSATWHNTSPTRAPLYWRAAGAWKPVKYGLMAVGYYNDVETLLGSEEEDGE
ncbi:hypothetical protein GCM10009733_097860 [Nonomuraea maheshkhaliensis]|uniref:Uncharacterized protein n=1 Tax=Nonomuraea maheshkhaliensis TaxID=419590 RepID=A0ABN2HEH8_9ACTN